MNLTFWDRFLEWDCWVKHKYICNCDEYYQIHLHMGYIILNSNQQYMIVPVSPQLWQQSMLSNFEIFPFLICKWQLIMVLFCIFLIKSKFSYAKGPLLSFFMNHLYISCPCFKRIFVLLEVLYVWFTCEVVALSLEIMENIPQWKTHFLRAPPNSSHPPLWGH